MKKIEIIWRELLYQSMEKPAEPAGRLGLPVGRRFVQKELAERFDFSTSTIFQALKVPRQMGAVRVTGRFFILEDPEKLLYHWASNRNLKKEIVFSARVELPIFEIEGRLPADFVFAGYSAARQILTEPPADYDKVFAYAQVQDSLEKLKKRFEFYKESKHPNLIILKGDAFLKNYGQITTLAQTFVDLWNMDDWYAREFTSKLKEKINEFLS